MNTVFLIGNLGMDTETRYDKNGAVVANSSMATKKRYKKDDEWHEVSCWHRLVAFGKNGERLAQLKKGNMVVVVGEVVTDQWTTDSGETRSATKIYVSNLLLATPIKLPMGGDSRSPHEPDLPF